MTKYAIFLDLDGTTLATHNTITTETISVVQKIKQQGHKVFIATGRNYYSTLPYHKMLGLDTPIITLNGGTIFRNNGDLLQHIPIDYEFIHKFLEDDIIQKELLVAGFEVPNKTILTEYGHSMLDFYTHQMPEDIEPNIALLPKAQLSAKALESTHNFYAFFEPQKLRSVLDYLENNFADNKPIALRKGNLANPFVECFPSYISKATGIKLVMDKLKLTDYTTMAIGDGSNDFEMLSYVDHAVAMKNAVPRLLELTPNHTKKTNAESGVADYLQEFFL